jgi:integrase
MSEGSITRRGKKSWRIKYDLPRDPETQERRIAYKTVRGTRKDAEREKRRLMTAVDKGVHVDPSALTVAAYMDQWLADVAPASVSPKSLEQYRSLSRIQIKPHLGTLQLQKLRPADIAAWHQALGKTGISVRSIQHAHGVLRTALAHAAAVEILERNVATFIRPPKTVRTEVEILNAEQIADALRKLEGHPIYPIAAVAIGTGARRGEIAALRWSDIDLDAATVRIERSLEQVKGSVRVKSPKTAAGRRTVTLPAFAVAALRDHRRQTLELRLRLGIGALPGDAPAFGNIEGNTITPFYITTSWRRAVRSRGLPKITFHSLRHSHASALIAAGVDVVTVSKRLGHASPALTLSTYSHLFTNSDDKAAAAIDAALSK